MFIFMFMLMLMFMCIRLSQRFSHACLSATCLQNKEKAPAPSPNINNVVD